MATIKTIKQALMICRDANITPWIHGHRGMGKSSAVNQLAVENGYGFIDLRCSQMEASDIRGLPDRVDGRTHYLPPSDMPIGDLDQKAIERELALVLFTESELNKLNGKSVIDAIAAKLENADLDTIRRYELKRQALQPRFQKGILFLDELNRAADDVLQAAFQLVLDRRVGAYVLPPGWSIVTAGNYMEGYQVSGFNDPAFLNRFCHLTLAGGESTLEEWTNYMATVHASDAANAIEFATQNVKHLDGDIAGDLGFSIQPSRRSWEMVVKVEKVINAGNYDPNAHVEVLSGLIGRELALSYKRYACPVKPRDILTRGVKAMESQLAKLDRNSTTGLMWGLVSFCKNKMDDESTINICLDFAEWMVHHSKDKDIVVAFCRSLVAGKDDAGNDEKARTAVLSNAKLAKILVKFNKKQGGNGKKSFIECLVDRPLLQTALAKTTWGSTGNKEDD